jgi:thiosulfate/3-mercaptopyruvate sulfurtransferase
MAEVGREFEHPEFLVDAAWVAAHTDDPNLVVVDTDVEAAYARGHIPGAVLVPDNLEKDPDTNRVNILPPQKFAAMAEGLGIGDNTLVIAYDNSQSLYASRLWWALNYYGHRNVKVLDGGWRRWVSEGHTIGLDRPRPADRVKFNPRPDKSWISTGDELKACCNLSDVVVWDVRTTAEYTGAEARGNKRAGHIPGAIHLEWNNLMDRETHRFKPASEIRRILAEKGITPDKEVHSY